MDLSARNQLSATVTGVKLGVVMGEIVVQLSGGGELVSVITRDSAERLNLQIGDHVTVIIK
jgi:molybdopterin-binding protein